MARKNSYLTVTDQFCGAGGSSQGVREFSNEIGGGIEVKMALNHWDLAIETHNTNFPDTDHHCTDISACDPRRYPSTDILITSPECTVHSPAGGRKRKNIAQMDCFTPYKPNADEDRSRATMWDVPRFAEYHNYNAIIVENVVEARDWILWNTWLQAMHKLGYQHKCCYFNSMHFQPTPQSRDRMYVVFWKKGNTAPDLDLRPKSFCKKCCKDVESVQWWKDPNKKWGKFGDKKRGQYFYRCSECHEHVEPYYFAAFNIIDWTIPGRPLHVAVRSKNTMRRIVLGLDKYGDEVVLPYFINIDHSSGGDISAVKHSYFPMRTQTTADATGIVMPSPIIIENNGQSYAKSITRPFPCATTEMKHGVLNPESLKGFFNYYNGGSDVVSRFIDPVGTITTVDRIGLVNYQKPTLEDCTYRTIRPHEVKAAMAFDKDYVVLGNGREQVKQLGNAVTPPVMKFIIGRTVETFQ